MKTLLLATGRDWLVKLAAASIRGDEWDLLTNRDVSVSVALEPRPSRVWRYRDGAMLTPLSLGPALIRALRKERYDEVVVPIANELGIGYRKVFLTAKLLGARKVRRFFAHAPAGNYDDRFKQGYWIQRGQSPYGRWYTDALLAAAEVPASARILDLGCGEGIFSEEFSRAGHLVTGLDYSHAGLMAAREALPEAGFIRADAHHLPFRENSFDAIFCRACSLIPLQLDSITALGEEWIRALRPGGKFLLVSPAIDRTGVARSAVGARHHSSAMLRDFFHRLGLCDIRTRFSHDRIIKRFGATALSAPFTVACENLSRIRPDFYVSVTIGTKVPQSMEL